MELMPGIPWPRHSIEAGRSAKNWRLNCYGPPPPPDSQSAVGEQAIEASEDVLRRSPQCLEVRRALGKRLVQVG